jgi:hypothetical protein
LQNVEAARQYRLRRRIEETEEESTIRRFRDAERMRRRRNKETPEEAAMRRLRVAERMRIRRNQETEEESAIRRARVAEKMRRRRHEDNRRRQKKDISLEKTVWKDEELSAMEFVEVEMYTPGEVQDFSKSSVDEFDYVEHSAIEFVEVEMYTPGEVQDLNKCPVDEFDRGEHSAIEFVEVKIDNCEEGPTIECGKVRTKFTETNKNTGSEYYSHGDS